MNILAFEMDGKKYEYIDSKKIDGINYVLYGDNDNVILAKYEIVNNSLKLLPVDENLLDKIKEVFNLE